MTELVRRLRSIAAGLREDGARYTPVVHRAQWCLVLARDLEASATRVEELEGAVMHSMTCDAALGACCIEALSAVVSAEMEAEMNQVLKARELVVHEVETKEA